MRDFIDEITESNAYKVWEYNQLEPEENLFVSKSHTKLPKQLPGWMTRGPFKEEEDNWEEKEIRGEEFLKKHGI